LKSSWQRHVLASSGYLELGMFDEAALALEEINSVDKTRDEGPGAPAPTFTWRPRNGTWPERWQITSSKVEPENSGWWINLAYATRRCEGH
jgi:hypothetical protein